MGRADLHIHTTTSFDGTASVSATLEHVATETSLDLIAITDHDEIDGALLALELAPRYGVQVIPGIEISTRDGHLLALDVFDLIPRGLPLARTLELVGSQGGYAIAPHAGGKWDGSLSREVIQSALRSPELAAVLLGGEAFNGSLPSLRANVAAARITHESGLAPVGCSDSHMLWTLGLTCTHYPGVTSDDLRRALVERATTAEVHARPWYFLASFLHRQALRGMGLAQWAEAEPGAQITLRRLARVREDLCAQPAGQ